MEKKIQNYRFNNSVYRQIKPLFELDNWHCFGALAEDWIIICFAIYISCFLSWYFYPLSILIIGSRQRALATMLHESAHRILAKNPNLNLIMGTFFSGYFILQIMSSYRKSHVENHHGNFGHPDKDPDYKFAISQGLYPTNIDDLRFASLLRRLPKYIKSLLVHRFLEDQKSLEILSISLWWLVIISVSILCNLWQYLILFWLIPYLTFFQIIGWFIELAEHYPLMNHQINLYMSRNRNSHDIELFLTGMHNENYHLVHHLFPNIPFWNVPKAHAILMQDPNYAQHHNQSGGIVWSNNHAASILSGLYNCNEGK